MSYHYYLKNRKSEFLELGKIYNVSWIGSNVVLKCKFIKTTQKGYNFLHIESNKCINKRHYYKRSDGSFLIHIKRKIILLYENNLINL